MWGIVSYSSLPLSEPLGTDNEQPTLSFAYIPTAVGVDTVKKLLQLWILRLVMSSSSNREALKWFVSEYPIKMIDGSEKPCAKVQCKWFSDNNHLTHSFFLHIDELENKIEESYEKAIFICISSILPSVVARMKGVNEVTKVHIYGFTIPTWFSMHLILPRLFCIDTDGQWKITSVPSGVNALH